MNLTLIRNWRDCSLQHLAAITAATILLLTAGCASGPHSARLRLDGGFIQYQSWMTNLNQQAWNQELRAMQKAGMRIVLLQHLQQGNRRFIPDSRSMPDPTEFILNYADAHQMEVFVGLANDSAWWKCNQWKTNLDALATKNMQFASEIWSRYGGHSSFAGWYLPQEMWEGPFTDEQVALARRFFKSVSDRCKSLSKGVPKPVAISPFHKARVTPAETEALYRDFLRGAGVDILMLQDGVGAKGWDENIEDKVVPYFRAIGRACQANHVEYWANVECFTQQFTSADVERLRRQMVATAPFVRRFVTFDFFHYMSPYRQNEHARKLYDGYLKLKGRE